MRLINIATILLLITFFGCQSNNKKQAGSVQHPNVVLILTDDQGWGDLGIHGNEKISTPVLDQMAVNSAEFRHFYVSPLCAPTRASLLTGKYHLRTGTSWVSKGLENMRTEEVTIAEVFHSAGYSTGAFGKWHNGAHFPEHPNQQGFDEFIGFCAGHWNNYFNTTLEQNGKPYPTQGYITDVLADEAMSFMENHREKPFFCYIPFNAPHGPFQVPDKYFDHYKALGFNDKDAAVYGMCENIDDNVGRILAKIEDLQLAENTIVIFMTDNGPNGERYNGGMRGIKGSIHEGGVRVPCFVQWKGKIDPKSIEPISAHIDILPTLVNLCNIKMPDGLNIDGVDLSGLLLGETSTLDDRLYFTKKSTENLIPDGAVRSERYRLVMEKGDTMLFDMDNDPGQKTDIAGEEPNVRDNLASAYNTWFAKTASEFVPNAQISIGFAKEDRIYLPAHEASFSGDIHFKEGHGWAHDWLINWINTNDSIYWDVVVHEPFDYQLSVLYSCPEPNLGSKIIANAGTSDAGAKITLAHDPPYIQGNDRVVRIEVYEKEWARLPMGTIHLSQGNQRIVLHAPEIPQGEVGEIKGVELSKVNQAL